eukprot:3070801-Pleurochrysis_carterae.AAC.1
MARPADAERKLSLQPRECGLAPFSYSSIELDRQGASQEARWHAHLGRGQRQLPLPSARRLRASNASPAQMW